MIPATNTCWAACVCCFRDHHIALKPPIMCNLKVDKDQLLSPRLHFCFPTLHRSSRAVSILVFDWFFFDVFYVSHTCIMVCFTWFFRNNERLVFWLEILMTCFNCISKELINFGYISNRGNGSFNIQLFTISLPRVMNIKKALLKYDRSV